MSDVLAGLGLDGFAGPSLSGPNAYIPNPVIIERTGRGERHYDVWSRLLEDRIVYLGTPINDTVANLLIGQLLVLEKSDRQRDVHLYINSPGGSISAGLAVYDTIQYIRCDVVTLCIGQAASMGSFLLAAGAAGKRYCLPNSRTMIHQPSGGAQGQASDIHIQAQEILKIRERLNERLAFHTGQSAEKIALDTERDNFMDANESKKYGLIDEVLDKRQ